MVCLRLRALFAAAVVASASARPFDASQAASAISTFYKNNRFKGAFLTCSAKACSADLVAQYIASKKEQERDEDSKRDRDNMLSKLNPLRKARGGELESDEVGKKKGFSLDLRRSLAFLLYGGFYQGCANEYIYNTIFPRLGTGTDMKTVAKKVAADMGFFSPMICIPMAYVVKGILNGCSIRESYANYWSDVKHKGVIYKNWMIFIPAQCLTFSIIPQHFRVAFVAGVSFFWMIILSCILGS